MQWLYKEKIAKRQALAVAFKVNFLKFLAHSRRVRPIQRARIIFYRQQFTRYSHITSIVRRCLNSGRTHNVPKRFLLGRMQFRSYVHLGKLPCISKYVK